MNAQGNIIHYRIAEQGKLYALEGNYQEALRYYREAMRITQRQKDSEVFFQHYAQCVMEALEKTGAYSEVIDFCDNYLAHLDTLDKSELTIKHRVYILERKAIQHLLNNEPDLAKSDLQQIALEDKLQKMVIAQELLKWVQKGYFITKKQIEQLQIKHDYYIVQTENVQPDIAMKLPKSMAPQSF
ncbi:MAG: hypothetical protein AAGA77_17530 [Bacteroidota bacterium]